MVDAAASERNRTVNRKPTMSVLIAAFDRQVEGVYARVWRG